LLDRGGLRRYYVDELDLGEPVTVSQSGGLADLFVGEVDPDHLAGLANLPCGAEDVRPGG